MDDRTEGGAYPFRVHQVFHREGDALERARAAGHDVGFGAACLGHGAFRGEGDEAVQ
jgi:hypothetical protein